MNSKNVSYVLAAVIVAMLLFSAIRLPRRKRLYRESGIWLRSLAAQMVGPGDSLNAAREYPTAIDTPQLFTQIFGVAVVGGIFLLLLRSKENK